MSGNESTVDSNTYTVESGDTIYAISRKMGVSVENLLAANPDLEDPSSIRVGQELALPHQGMHVVAPGDTFSEIADKYGVSIEALHEVNDEIQDVNRIRVGQQIRLPLVVDARQLREPAGAATQTYEVRSGDTFSEIAEDHGISQAELERLNPQITNPSRIGVGQEIHVPASSRQPAQPQQRQQPPAPQGEEQRPLEGEPRRPRREMPRHDNNWNQPRRLMAFDGNTGSGNLPHGAVDNAWATVEGRSVRPTFQNVAYDPRPHIVIALGHGGDNKNGENDPGAVGPNGLRETDVVDPVGQALGERFEVAGYRVSFVRDPGEEYRYGENDAPGRLSSRARFAHALEDQIGAPYTVFISLHANAAAEKINGRWVPRPGVNGFEVLVDKDGSGRGDRSTATSETSVHLGDSVLRHMDGYEGMNNRGLKTYNASVLNIMENGDSTPGQADSAILIELGFVTGEEDMKTLADMALNPDEMANRIFRGTHEHIQSRNPEPEPESKLQASLDRDPPTFST